MLKTFSMAFNQYVKWYVVVFAYWTRNNTIKLLKTSLVAGPWWFLSHPKASQASPQVITFKQSQEPEILAPMGAPVWASDIVALTWVLPRLLTVAFSLEALLWCFLKGCPAPLNAPRQNWGRWGSEVTWLGRNVGCSGKRMGICPLGFAF